IADAFMCNIDKGTRTERTISKVEVKTSRATRSGIGADTLLYLINYADNNGFALVSADKRLPAIYAISDEGHFEFADTLQNNGLAFFMKTVDNSINYSMEQQADIIVPNDSVHWNKNYYDQFKFTYNVIQPKLKRHMSRISQGAPFNKYCIEFKIQRPTGCAPIAVAALMSFYRWPESYKGHQYPWDEIVEGQNYDAIARLIYDLWDKDNLFISAEYDRTTGEFLGMAPENKLCLINAFQHMGYIVKEGQNALKSFNKDDMIEVLRRGYDNPPVGTPILARGIEHINGKDKGGHVWVIDGAMWQHGKIGDGITAPGIGSEPHYNPNMPMCLFHCVWGWGGSQNGFFNFDNNAIGGDPDFYGEYDSTEKGKSHLINLDLEYIGYIKRDLNRK
ncbi:MAG: C10 family peptidase, partial [Muribaculaceae bacterium]|nr:C10 family peptidase [Muribaculaceae bacterium]